ncbi:DUF411 domain-containing protein [Pseudoxanthomonas sp. UTMC 1351]|uniref:DUF411 domain-containing protein n=1 Tax=Pseudoxanthomonas sp. UTMC 1351 TaxID=2695853 RepID=UPI0034CE94C1
MDIAKTATETLPLASAQAASATSAKPSTSRSQSSKPLPKVLVHKSESCGCCGAWVDHLRTAGFTVEVRNSDDLQPVKLRLGITPSMMSCHTAEVGGYFVEGHVPAADVKRLLAEKPDVKGLVLPGMPLGSPGMEVPDGRVQPYVVSSVDKQGQLSDYAHHGH